MTAANSARSARLRLRLSAAGERSVRAGHPWVYEASVREQNRPGTTGELAVIYDKRDQFLAVGLFDAESVIRVRILHAGKPALIDAGWLDERLAAALAKRRGLFDASTDGYRLINGESDGWPGLVLDKYSDCVVLKIYTGAWLPRLADIVECIKRQCCPGCVVLRLSRNIQSAAAADFGAQDGSVIAGRLVSNPVQFLENGIRFEADVLKGQKTGFFLDQRDNRRRVEGMAAGRTVLNAFSFSGGFSLYAARGGARSVTDLDISSHAIESSRRNWGLNEDLAGITACSREWIQGDAFDWLEADAGKRFGMIVLDPPSLAKRESERDGAIRAYARLARLGAARIEADGILACFSCSAHVSEKEFFGACLEGVLSRGEFQEIARTAHAPDHPALIEESKYLKGIYLRAG